MRPTLQLWSYFIPLWSKCFCPHPVKFIYWNPNSPVIVLGGGIFGRWLGSDKVKRVKSSWIGFVSFWELRASLPPLSALHLVRIQRAQNKSGSSLEPGHSGTLILDFLPPDVRNKFLLFISHPICTLCYSSNMSLIITKFF